jgi:hypothetical protein
VTSVSGKIGAIPMLQSTPELGTKQHSCLQFLDSVRRLAIWAVEVRCFFVVISSNRILESKKIRMSDKD